jgi:hypothetical protein
MALRWPGLWWSADLDRPEVDTKADDDGGDPDGDQPQHGDEPARFLAQERRFGLGQSRARVGRERFVDLAKARAQHRVR